MTLIKQKRSPAYPFHREVLRHPHFFLVLLSFVFLGAMSAFLLILSSITSRDSQDLRQRAAEDGKAVVVQFNPRDEIKVSREGAVVVTAASSSRVDAIELDFVIRGVYQTLSTLNVVVKENNGFNQERFVVSNDGNGDARVQLTLLSSSPANGTQVTAPGVELLRLNFTPVSADDIAILTDNTASNAYIVGRTDDQLSTLNTAVFRPSPAATANPVTSTTTLDNLYFTTDNSLELFKESNNQSIAISEIRSGERYKLKQRVRVQNVAKNNASTDNHSVTVQFRANDSATASKNFAMSELQKAANGLDIVFEVAFVGSTDNVFKATLDTANTIAETNENDNTFQNAYKYEVTTTVTPNSVAEACNDYCANDGECKFDLKCWYNKCRHPDNVESDRCVPKSGTVVGCNLNCQTNRDCAAGLTCSGNKCRNPKSPSSDTCQTVTVQTVVTPKKTTPAATAVPKGGTTAKATIKPSSAPSASPAANIGMLVTPAPTSTTGIQPTTQPSTFSETQDGSGTVLNDVTNWLGQIPAQLQSALAQTPLSGVDNLWLWLVGGGVVLMALIALISMLSRRSYRSLPPVPPPSHTATKTITTPVNVVSHQNPGASLQDPLSTSAQFSKPYVAPPSLLAVPRPLPNQAAASNSTPVSTTQPSMAPMMNRPVAASTPGASMLNRLQDRGVIKPSPQTVPVQSSTSSSVSTPVFPPKPTS